LLFAGRTLVGRATATYLRGILVAANRSLVAEPGVGPYLPGRGADGAYPRRT
jgi:hypothetical protein